MKIQVEEKVIRFLPEGRIDASNSGSFESDIFAACQEHPAHIPLFDMKKLEYISSAGLRVLLKVVHNYDRKLRMVNVSDEVYDVLTVSGFVDVFNVYKENMPLMGSEHPEDIISVRSIDVSQYEHTYSDDVLDTYLTDDDTTIMLYGGNLSLEMIMKNKAKSEISMKAGVPVLISFDVVSCDGRYGIVYENIKDAEQLILKMQNDRANLSHYASVLALWTKEINSVDMSGAELESANRTIIPLYSRLKTAKLLTPAEAEILANVIKNVPDLGMYCHNDLTPHNILAKGDEYIAMDSFMAAKGHCIHDVANIAWYFKLLPQLGVDSQAVGFTDSEKELIWNTFIRTYFGTDDEDFLYKAEYQILQFASAKYLTMAALWPDYADRSTIMKLKRTALSMAEPITPLCF